MTRSTRRSRIAEWASLVDAEVPEGALAEEDAGRDDPWVAGADPAPDSGTAAGDEDA